MKVSIKANLGTFDQGIDAGCFTEIKAPCLFINEVRPFWYSNPVREYQQLRVRFRILLIKAVESNFVEGLQTHYLFKAMFSRPQRFPFLSMIIRYLILCPNGGK